MTRFQPPDTLPTLPDGTFQDILRALEEGVVVYDSTGRRLWWNDAAERVSGRAEEWGSAQFLHEDGESMRLDEIPSARVLRTGEAERDVVVGIAREGATTWVRVNALPIGLGDDARGVLVTTVDVTDRHSAIRDRATAEAQLDSVLASVDDYLYAWRYYPDGRTETVFESGTQEDLLGVPWPEGMDALEHWRSAVHSDDLREFDELLIGAQQRGESGAREYRVLDAGSLRWMHDRWRTHRLADGSTVAEGIVTDVTERHRAESELHTLLATLQDAYSELDLSRAHAERQSRTDALTGLANRRHFRDSLELTLARRDGVTRGPGVIMIDVDFFKQINDQYGHAAGDAVLVETARRIQHAARDNDLAARWGGEEFVLCAPDIVDEAALRRLADRLRRAIARQPMLAVGFEIAVTASVGAAFATTTGQSADELLDLADQAMYGAKRSGRNRTRLTGQKTATAAAEEPDAIRIARALALAASLREGAPAGHADHVAQLAGAVAQNLGLSADVVLRCRLAGLLHDVGKAAIPDRILFKPGPLTKAEWRTMRTHPAISERIVRRVPGLTGAARLVRHHHERWDGAGYPDQLAGEAIPIEARVIAAADAYSAMLTDRPYRRACSRREAIAELQRAAGSQLDPTIVDALVRTTRRQQWVQPPAADVSAAALRQAA
ncbi:MAG: hypothetical protein QOI43_1709 [Gaiellales bacterium]|nr:hypothetical protein [Gaiellales bacterium]